MLKHAAALLGVLFLIVGSPEAMGTEIDDQKVPVVEKTVDQKIDEGFAKVTGPFVNTIFSEFSIDGYGVKWIILWLALGGLICTLAFKFVNFSAFPLAVRTVRGKYSTANDPGEITHFQALTSAVSGTVGLGNIAGVAIGISIGGPGVAFWLFVAGFLGMATKFAECTLGVKYRETGADGKIHGGGMYYLKKGLAERGMAPLGQLLALLFAIFCVFASFGGGNIFQVNQTTAQLINVTGGAELSFFADKQWIFGVTLAILTGLVILGGIQGIAKVTSKLVPAMCFVYIVSAAIVLVVNSDKLGGAISMIMSEAFQPRPAVVGGFLAAFIWGIRRATFSNEAGIGSAAIAHAAVKTRKPASEGVVALLEPFIDSVIVCSMTSLVIVSSMTFDGGGDFAVNGAPQFFDPDNNNNAFGIGLTSLAFESVHSSFRYILFICVLLFAFSTLITWSYYGLQAWQYLLGRSKIAENIYKVIFCLVIVVGSSTSMGAAVDFSDAALFAMSVPNLIGVYLMIPLIRKEYAEFVAFTKRIDAGASPEDAE
ncbi:alanine/glycine:cation symporter family protein [Verrucomicrobiaceae bacterium 227]